MPFGVPGMPGTPLTQKLVGTVYRVVALALGADKATQHPQPVLPVSFSSVSGQRR
ncbi:MAG: hypothetical protein KAX55_04460 [Propionivibrio sp.]|jgi:hypothetical protein|uniref:Uncharacterized protein n=1 Tax=Burkholderia orbicola TaxID=2978683 RepID=A0ABT8NWI4_9BURK|nr:MULTISPECIES: hypothetical protein [Pseudomonadota]MBP8276125.1 hypothetical protein [Propionivibrio sp.]EKW5506276.1 hypothetical protein [Pseudomonas aeruginosa]EKW5579008.1 hypothetical protein [Pseudomonas aeruginosa]MDN7525930.1 hypothetical protein [Burkholderia orbicola]HEK4046198.1 hypothetical protein [Pseudomonas aeruginosa]